MLQTLGTPKSVTNSGSTQGSPSYEALTLRIGQNRINRRLLNSSQCLKVSLNRLIRFNLIGFLVLKNEIWEGNRKTDDNGYLFRIRRGQCYKTFLSLVYQFLYLARVFVPGEPFQPGLMFAGKARAYPSEASTFQVLHCRIGPRTQSCRSLLAPSPPEWRIS